MIPDAKRKLITEFIESLDDATLASRVVQTMDRMKLKPAARQFFLNHPHPRRITVLMALVYENFGPNVTPPLEFLG